jgi:Restriction endonuclease
VPRQQISEQAKHEVLLASKRRCPLCFVAGNRGPRKGAVAHIDRNRSSSAANDLVFLCLDHHRQLDEGSLTTAEITTARAALYKALNTESPHFLDERPWSAYERLVVDLVRSSMAERLGDYFGLRAGDSLTGRSGIVHEVDLVVEFRLAQAKYLTVFEIKHRPSTIGVEDVMRFAAVIDDIGANKGVFVANGGFSAAATQLARSRGIDLLRVPDDARRLDDTLTDVSDERR